MFPHPQIPFFQFSTYGTWDLTWRGRILVSFCTSAAHSVQTGAFMGLVQISGKTALSMCKLQVPEVWNLTEFGQIFVRMKKSNDCYTSLPFFSELDLPVSQRSSHRYSLLWANQQLFLCLTMCVCVSVCSLLVCLKFSLLSSLGWNIPAWMVTRRQIFQKVKQHLIIRHYKQSEYHHSFDNAAVLQTHAMGHRDLMVRLRETCS